MPTPRTNHTITACRLLLLLQQLIQHRSLTYTSINQLFQSNPTVGRPIGSETLTKYIATLRYWGCTIPKASLQNQFHYQLAQYPLPTRLTPQQWSITTKAVNHSLQWANPATRGTSVTKEKSEQTHSVLTLLSWWLGLPYQSSHDQKPSSVLSANPTPMTATVPQHTTAVDSTWRSQWQQWWQGGTWVQVTLLNHPTPITVEPQGFQTTTYGCIATGWEVTSARWISIPLATIVLMHPLPMRSRGRGQRMTLTFQVTGRLAKNYRLYPEETDLSSSKMTAARVIQARVDDSDALMTRLMKYGPHCEVLSPQWARDTMQQRIRRLRMAPSQSAVTSSSPVQY